MSIFYSKILNKIEKINFLLGNFIYTFFNSSHVICSEREWNLYQYATSNELEVPQSVNSQYRKPTPKTITYQWQPNLASQRESRTRNKNRLVLRAILTKYVVKPV